MKNSKFSVRMLALMALACVCVVSLVCVCGCAAVGQSDTQATDAQSENRQYMTEINQKMELLQTRLDSFIDAVSRKDIVTMRTQADNAFKVIDEISDLDVPSSLEDIHQDYLDGVNNLKDALNSYIDLYAEIDSATDEAPFDYSTYDERPSAIQEQYNSGIEKLKAGDEAAAAKE